MKKVILITFLALIGISNLWALPGIVTPSISQQTTNITATITKETTEQQLEELKKYFADNGIIVSIENTTRNASNEITGLRITIKKESQQSSYNMSSNLPINDLELGYKDGNVFVGTTDHSLAFNKNSSLQSLLQGLNQNNGTSLDSLLSQNEFSFSFGSDDIRKLLNSSSFDFDQLQDQFFSQFFNNNPSSKSNTSTTPSQNAKKTIPKYSFFNSKNISKLIIIDGKEADFETLNQLAKADKLEEVDNLKSSTAISIYGEKGKDGAIIATSKAD